MDDERRARASNMERVQDEAQHGMFSCVDLAAMSVTMLRQQNEPTSPTQGLGVPISIGIDFGTSNTAVSVSKDGQGSRPVITDIKNYPGDPLRRSGEASPQVPTETWYSTDSEITQQNSNTEDEPTDTPSDALSDAPSETSLDRTTACDDSVQLPFDSDQSMIGDGTEHGGHSEYDSDQSMTGYGMEHVGLAENNMQSLHWGYGVRSKLRAELPRSNYNHVTRSKLLLDKFEDTATANARRLEQQAKIATDIFRIQETTGICSSPLPRNGMKTRSGLLIPLPLQDKGKEADYDILCKTVGNLKRQHHIENKLDVIDHFLTQVLCHVKQELAVLYDISCPLQIKYVLSVPVAWKSTALLAMQNSLRVAIDASGLGTMDDLFLVSEPEAAANFLIQKKRHLKPGDKFLTLDCGGGTIDATAYETKMEYPLRLSKELVEPDGCTHGSSLLNRDFRKHLKRRIEGQRKTLEIGGYTFEGILDQQVLRFEDRFKRLPSIFSKPELLEIQGLKADPKRRLVTGAVVLDPNDFKGIFMSHLRPIAKLLRRQLVSAMRHDDCHRITKVILTGGFSASFILRHYLKRELEEISREFGYKIELICGLDELEHETAVVRGALIRANDKSYGPQRISQLSYGVEIMEEHNPERFSAHKTVKPTMDKTDGRYYVNNVISWLIVKGDFVLPSKQYRIPVYRIFDATDLTFVCAETLYVSDTSKESHYRRTHENNKGARVAGRVEVDMGFLVTDGLIKPIKPDGINTRRHYKIEFDLIMTVNGRNLRFEACWQIDGRSLGGHKDISIAAAFTPGTL